MDRPLGPLKLFIYHFFPEEKVHPIKNFEGIDKVDICLFEQLVNNWLTKCEPILTFGLQVKNIRQKIPFVNDFVTNTPVN